MTTCKKCGREFSEEFLFCPYCGKKKSEVNNNNSAQASRALFWAFCRDGDLAKEMQKMYEKHMNAEEMAQYVRGPMDSMNAWAIAYEYYDSYGKKMRTREGVVSANGLRGIANYRYRDQKIRAWPVERVLLKTNINKIGKQYFWTKEECQEAIDEALREG